MPPAHLVVRNWPLERPGSCSARKQLAIPSTAVAYSTDVIVAPNTALGFLTLWPAGQTQPLTSLLNSDGRVKANAAIVPWSEWRG